MQRLSQGDRVVHNEHGEGTVVKKRQGNRVVVAFDLAPKIPINILRDDLFALEDELEQELAAVDSGTNQIQRTKKETPRQRSLTLLRHNKQRHAERSLAKKNSADQIDSFQIIEALRLGVVPHHGVETYTVGREQEIASIQRMLDKSQGCRVIWGDYGAGKTHLLDVSEQMARRAGFATARITLDPREHALSHPLRLYRSIAESIHLPGAASGGLDPIFEALIDSAAHNSHDGAEYSRFFSPYLFVLKHGNQEQCGWFNDYIHGYRIERTQLRIILNRLGWRSEIPLTLSDYRTYGRMYTHMIGTLASWTKAAGAQGLVLLFDEVERIDALDNDQQRYAIEVLKHFAAVTMKKSHLEFDPDHLYRGGHEVHREIPLRFRKHQPLSVVFALTPLPEINEMFGEITDEPIYDVLLDRLQSKDMGKLASSICRVYEKTYPLFETKHFRDDLVEICKAGFQSHDNSFRAAVRACVFRLDEERLGLKR